MVFFFPAADGIRGYKVTGVQTCALPICSLPVPDSPEIRTVDMVLAMRLTIEKISCIFELRPMKIGRASCRARGDDQARAGSSLRKPGGERTDSKTNWQDEGAPQADLDEQ